MAKLSRVVARIERDLIEIKAMLIELGGEEFEASWSEKYQPAPPPSRAELKAASKPAEENEATQGAIELAEAEGFDLASVEGSGSGGKITKGDVQKALAAE